MSWGTDFNVDLYLSREVYRTKYEVEERIKELSNSINSTICNIKMFASSNIKDILPDEWKNEPINWLSFQLTENFEYYEQEIILRYKLELYLDYLNDNKIKNIIVEDNNKVGEE